MTMKVKLRTAIVILALMICAFCVYHFELIIPRQRYLGTEYSRLMSTDKGEQNGQSRNKPEASIVKRRLTYDCGDICSYETNYSSPGKYYEFLRKDVKCINMLARMGMQPEKVIFPPPKKPPVHLKDTFIQHGECPISRQFYRVDFNPNKTLGLLLISASTFNEYLIKDKKGLRISAYQDNMKVRETLHKYKEYLVEKDGFVVGTERPWIESMLVNLNVNHITTLEYRPLTIEHPKVDTITPYLFSDKYSRGETKLFDFGFSYSSVEHAGLGRYGDPLNPYGDLEAMAQAWCITKPGGIYILGLGVGHNDKCYIEWNAHRMYGTARLKHLTANWEVLDQIPTHGSYNHYVWVLRKPFI